MKDLITGKEREVEVMCVYVLRCRGMEQGEKLLKNNKLLLCADFFFST